MDNTISLRSNRDFRFIYDNGIYRAERSFVMYIRENGNNLNRLGISVSKKVGNSVIRHRVKRLVKEVYRLNEYKYKKGFDIVIVARVNAPSQDFLSVGKSIEYLGKKLGIIEC